LEGGRVELESYQVAQTGLELAVLLPQPPEYWDYRCVPPHSKILRKGLFPVYRNVKRSERWCLLPKFTLDDGAEIQMRI
jgi:hypothetical protein